MRLLLEMTNCCDEWDWEDDKECLDEILKRTRIKNGFMTIRNSGWRKLSGYTEVFPVSANNILDKIGDYEWTLRVKKEGQQLYLIRSSHDEPTGAQIMLHSSKHFTRLTGEEQ